MFRRGSFIFRFLGALLFIALLVGGGMMVFQAGQSQGYALAAGATSGVQPALPATMPYFGYGTMHPHFFPFMGFFGFIPMLIGFFIVLSIFRHLVFGYPHRGYCHCAGSFHRHHPWGDDQPCEEHGEHEKTPPPTSGEANSEKK